MRGVRLGSCGYVLTVLAVCGFTAAGAEVRLSGRITSVQNAPLSGVRLTLSGDGVNLSATSDATGIFRLTVPRFGVYEFTAERTGFFRLREPHLKLDLPSEELNLVLEPIGEIFETLEVTASPPGIDMSTTESSKTITGTQVLEVPYPATHSLKNATRLFPNVIQDNQGSIHVAGGSESQTLYTLDGFVLNDPLTGRFDSRMSVESISTMELVSGRVPAEWGRGSAGALNFTSRSGDDRFRYSATNFFPGLSFQKGLSFSDWTPRFNVSGPLRRGRAWLSNSSDLQYKQTIIAELPVGTDRTRSWRGSNLLNGQFNITSGQILTAGLLANFWQAPRSNLGALDPPETTTDQRSRQWFFRMKDQIYLQRGALVEVGYASNRTYGREIPQGHEFLQMHPNGRLGNGFVDAVRFSNRHQWIANAFLPSFDAVGSHRIKTGIDLSRVAYQQDVRRTGYARFRIDGTRLDQVTFAGHGTFERSNFETAAFVQDSWKPRAGLLVELGLRQDWDRLVRKFNVAPRMGIAWSPGRLESTKISAGYGVAYDASSLRLFSRPFDQYSVITRFDPAGSPVRGASANVFRLGGGDFRSPRYTNVTLGLEQRLPYDLFVTAGLLVRRGRQGFTYVNSLRPGQPIPLELQHAYGVPVFDALYELRNSRRDAYDAVEISARQVFRKQYEWMISYTRSRTRSTAAVDVSVDDPIYVTDNYGPMPWDSPNRVISWGLLPVPRSQWAVAYLLECRDGFPFSIQSEEGAIVGPVNSQRYPLFVELNLHLERPVELFGSRWAIRAGYNNILGRKNPNQVNNNLASPYFLYFYGGQSRSLNFRIRFLGKARR